MSLVRMMYVSNATKGVGYHALKDILNKAVSNNRRDGLTGLLCYGVPHFLQVIEGPRAAVSRLLGSLYRDSRHEQVEVIEFAPVEQREFSRWEMKLVSLDELPAGPCKEVFRKFAVDGRFAPKELSMAQTLDFLKSVAATSAG